VQGGHVGADELVVACITGAGLKTQEAVADVLPPALNIEATVESFEAALLERHGPRATETAPV
jgi:threonine synthase